MYHSNCRVLQLPRLPASPIRITLPTHSQGSQNIGSLSFLHVLQKGVSVAGAVDVAVEKSLQAALWLVGTRQCQGDDHLGVGGRVRIEILLRAR